jgi:hypothetical protein
MLTTRLQSLVYFYIFGFRVKTVMHTVGLVLLSQAGTVAAFGWVELRHS